MSNILVVGSVAYDTISTPNGTAQNLVGGSANYFAMSSSLYAKVNVVGVVGDDYKEEDLDLLKKRNVDLTGLKRVDGKTFHWEGRYEQDMNEAITLKTQLNVFENFDPVLPESYRKTKYVFLANIDPVLQMKVLDQIEEPRLVGADTMNFWIDTKKAELKELLKRVDVLLINEGEARKLAETWNTVEAIQKLADMGPKGIIVKRGEYGFMFYTRDNHSVHPYFILPAFPVEKVVDPTGAGDTFAGGFFGYLAKLNETWRVANLKQACIHGCLLASFTVQGFGLQTIEQVDWAMVEKRQQEYQKIISCQG